MTLQSTSTGNLPIGENCYETPLSEQQQKMFNDFIVDVLGSAEKKYKETGYLPSYYEKNVIYNKRTLIRFLKARKWDFNASKEMYYKSMEYRQKFQNIGFENVTEEMCESELKSGKSFSYKYDKQNRIITYVFPRLHFPAQSTVEDGLKAIVFYCEKGFDVWKLPQEKGLIIYDLKGMKMANMDLKGFQPQLELMDLNYPELGAALVVNCPLIFWGGWQIIKRWLDPNIAAKVRICRGTEEIKEFVRDEDLIEELGGKDKYKYRYIPKKERTGENANYVPPWELGWLKEEERKSITEENERIWRESAVNPVDFGFKEFGAIFNNILPPTPNGPEDNTAETVATEGNN